MSAFSIPPRPIHSLAPHRSRDLRRLALNNAAGNVQVIDPKTFDFPTLTVMPSHSHGNLTGTFMPGRKPTVRSPLSGRARSNASADGSFYDGGFGRSHRRSIALAIRSRPY